MTSVTRNSGRYAAFVGVSRTRRFPNFSKKIAQPMAPDAHARTVREMKIPTPNSVLALLLVVSAAWAERGPFTILDMLVVAATALALKMRRED